MNDSAHKESGWRRYGRLLNSGEPFRLLFPLGALLGVVGVLVWPLYVWKHGFAYPGQIHARVMIECFFAAFVLGFLGTSLPRLLGVKPLGAALSVPLAVLLGATAVLHLLGRGLGGDLVFLFLMTAFVGVLLSRARKRQDIPPPSFVLVAMGFLAALMGVSLQILDRVWPMLIAPWVGSLGRILLNQGFPLLPILGVGAFLLPRFFGLPGRQSFPESLTPPPGWRTHAAYAGLAGGAVVVSFFLEALGFLRAGYALRFIVVVVYFARELPPRDVLRGRGTLALGLKIALLSIPAGYLMLSIWPSHYFAWLHTTFIPGFSLLIFIVACRVVFGHGGYGQKFHANLWSVLTIISLLSLAAFTRITADWIPKVHLTHYAYAAIVWIIGVLIWLVTLRKALFEEDDSD